MPNRQNNNQKKNKNRKQTANKKNKKPQLGIILCGHGQRCRQCLLQKISPLFFFRIANFLCCSSCCWIVSLSLSSLSLLACCSVLHSFLFFLKSYFYFTVFRRLAETVRWSECASGRLAAWWTQPRGRYRKSPFFILSGSWHTTAQHTTQQHPKTAQQKTEKKTAKKKINTLLQIHFENGWTNFVLRKILRWKSFHFFITKIKL